MLYEKFWNKGSRPRQFRREETTKFLTCENLNHSTFLCTFALSREFAAALHRIGSFVFLRRADDPMFFQFPVGIMDVADNIITVTIEQVGPKSTRLFTNGNIDIIVRGPYVNGVLGSPWIENAKNKHVIVAAGGIGQAPALPIIKRLTQDENHVSVILAPGKVGSIFIADTIKAWGTEVCEVTSLRKDGMDILRKFLKKEADFLVSAGPDAQHYGIIGILNEMHLDLPMAVTNNATMCCGEGICGSCHQTMSDGRVVKLCKLQTDFRHLE